MAIQNVNGRNVYVLTPKAPTGKTTSGKNWATLYSDLRWQVWEAQKENEAKKIELDLMSFKAQKEYYDQQKKFLQNRIADLQDIKLKTGQGGANADINQALRALEATAPKSLGGRGASGPKFTRKVVTGRTDVGGEPIESPLITETVTGTLEAPPQGLTSEGQKIALKEGTGAQAGTIIGPSKSAQDLRDALMERAMNRLKAEGEEEGIVGGDIDAEIKKLEDQLAGLAAPQFQTETDLLNRTQRAFEQNVGVIGQGGGPFGLAPRSRRLAPRVDQPRATAFAQDLAAVGSAEAAARRQLEEDRRALMLRREDIMAAAEVDSEDAVAVIDEQLADVNAQLLQPTIAQRLMSDESFIERAPGEFLLREQNREPRAPRPDDSPRTTDVSPPRQRRNIDLDFLSGLGNLASEGIPSVYFGSGAGGEAGLSSTAPQTEPFGGAPDSAPSVVPDLQTNVSFGMPTRGVPQPGEAGLRSPPFISRDKTGRDKTGRNKTDLEALGVGQETDIDPVLRDKDATDATVTIPLGSQAFPPPEQGRENAAADLYASYAPRKINADTGEDMLTPLSKIQKDQIFSKWLAEEEVTSTLDDEGAKKWYNNAVKELKAGQGGKAVPPTSKQRKELYSFNVSSDGLKLAQKPKQLARLAKTSLPEDKRPQHIVIVDKLFETNSGKTNAFRLTYDEISRVFANDPKKRTEAHKYLVAKDVLEGNKREPLA